MNTGMIVKSRSAEKFTAIDNEINRRRVRKTPEPLTKLEVFYIAKHTMFTAAVVLP